RAWLQNLTIGAYFEGILVDGAQDFVKIDHLIIHPFWDIWTGRSLPQPIDAWVYDNGYGIVVGRADALAIADYFTFSRDAGLMLQTPADGVAFGVGTALQFDSMRYGIISFGTEATVGFSVANSYMNGANFTTSPNPPAYGIILNPGPDGTRSLITVVGGAIS